MELPETELRKLEPGSEFRRPGGEHRYLVGNVRVASGGNVQIYCHNLTNGNAYFWSAYSKVIPIVRKFPAYVEDHCCPASRTRLPFPFWMCAAENGGPPTVRHPHEGLARSEAERIARLTGKPVYLLEAVSKVSLEVVPVTKRVIWSK